MHKHFETEQKWLFVIVGFLNFCFLQKPRKKKKKKKQKKKKKKKTLASEKIYGCFFFYI